jgi:hypothetical protein
MVHASGPSGPLCVVGLRPSRQPHGSTCRQGWRWLSRKGAWRSPVWCPKGYRPTLYRLLFRYLDALFRGAGRLGFSGPGLIPASPVSSLPSAGFLIGSHLSEKAACPSTPPLKLGNQKALDAGAEGLMCDARSDLAAKSPYSLATSSRISSGEGAGSRIVSTAGPRTPMQTFARIKNVAK